MKTQDPREQEIMEALKREFRARAEGEGDLPGRAWEQAVMRRVRAMDSTTEAGEEEDWWSLFELSVRRLAPAASILVVILSVLLFRLDLSSEYMLATAFMEEPFGDILIQSIGI
ncbi:MAG: hypothetical protein MI751_17870 [Pseudomonadales bacterium]|nr:hypothetical protein [Pseudomonadales bacterium]